MNTTHAVSKTRGEAQAQYWNQEQGWSRIEFATSYESEQEANEVADPLRRDLLTGESVHVVILPLWQDKSGLTCEQCGCNRSSLNCVGQVKFEDTRMVCDTCMFEIGLRGHLIDNDGHTNSRREFLATLEPVQTMTCCCCGEPCEGRQWHNRDTGFGLCPGCVTLCFRGTTNQEFESCYGVRGVHCGEIIKA